MKDCPTVATLDVLADLTMLSAGDWVAVTVAVDAADVTAAPVGGVPVTVAEFLIVPVLKSAAVAE